MTEYKDWKEEGYTENELERLFETYVIEVVNDRGARVRGKDVVDGERLKLKVYPQPSEEDIEIMKELKDIIVEYIFQKQEEAEREYEKWKEEVSEYQQEMEELESPIYDALSDMLENASYEEERRFWEKVEYKRGLAFIGDDPFIAIALSRSLWKPYIIVPHFGLCEFGSKAANLYIPPNSYLIDAFKRLENLLSTLEIQEYLLGKEGLRDYFDTADDRRLVEALNNGASMDMETGRIIGFDSDADFGE